MKSTPINFIVRIKKQKEDALEYIIDAYMPLVKTIAMKIYELIQKEAKNEILFALTQLEELDRNIFMMKYYLEISNSEIADSLGLTKAAVDNRIYRGKKVLATNPKLKERFV
ncbi:hypothetical protein CSE16_03540 [Solibacillus sp. R5-41]|uniref:sigma factor-like helix-turn-helix DNA-binding protein n=1 Tax=Solibacillus sp. R5-41 TaxID=2048654 RepID=UPI000C12797E|nr:sigma factor-like helix-turn-helix DNA-binding protein [Solibacillus sp. R5-41]ATP39177.1 hypothetical protein CSE16_03540 [Solibacillus sp. R5-41]